MISDDQLKRFMDLWEARFKKPIGKEEAYEKAIKLVRLIDIVYTPMSEREWELVQEDRKKDGYI